METIMEYKNPYIRYLQKNNTCIECIHHGLNILTQTFAVNSFLC